MILYFLSFASIQLPGFSVAATNTYSNNVPPRYQWDGNEGYCGEVSLISASLFYGTYISQYDIRAIAGKGKAQNQCQLLVGVNDQYTATQLHLTSIEFNTKTEQNTNQFLIWVKQNVLRGSRCFLKLPNSSSLHFSFCRIAGVSLSLTCFGFKKSRLHF